MRYQYFVFLLLISLVSCQSTSTEITTIYLLRHAEKVSDQPEDPVLNMVGERRSTQLADLLIDVDIDAIYSTEYNRTKATVQPIADMKDKMITLYTPDKEEKFLKHVFKNHGGKTVLIVGHSNTIPPLVNHLIGEKKYENLKEDEYDKIFIVEALKLGKGKANILRYGNNLHE